MPWASPAAMLFKGRSQRLEQLTLCSWGTVPGLFYVPPTSHLIPSCSQIQPLPVHSIAYLLFSCNCFILLETFECKVQARTLWFSYLLTSLPTDTSSELQFVTLCQENLTPIHTGSPFHMKCYFWMKTIVKWKCCEGKCI